MEHWSNRGVGAIESKVSCCGLPVFEHLYLPNTPIPQYSTTPVLLFHNASTDNTHQ
jgi:hypothetical protein